MTETEIHDIRRQLVQRLDSLRRAGIDRIPKPPLKRTTVVVAAPAPAAAPEVSRPVPRPAPSARPTPVVVTPASLFAYLDEFSHG